ncbi:MAG TPA: hypothetical protein VI759_10465, partial [Dehalococcoidia bacterium]|nr:hypothetical protein [Dehalococcoidia bacterium]
WLAASEACDWIRRVRREGAAWRVLPQPAQPELYPETGNTQDGPWHAAKSQIAKQIDDLTLLWNVRDTARSLAHRHGVTRWTDPACTPELLGLEKERARVLQAVLDVNRGDGAPVWPARIHESEREWRPVPPLEFYVDFEFVNNLADDLRDFPNTSGEPLIFIIGCGHVEDGEWRFECFVADALDSQDEARIIDAWFAHMAAVRARLDPGGDEPRLYNWSPAEPSNLETSYNSARDRHPDKHWPPARWFDFLSNVVRKEPVVVRGALMFGLKPIAKAMHSHGLIDTVWGDGPTDGLGAMVGAWWCEDERKRLGVSLRDIDLMQEIVNYNEVDCKVMMEVVRYLRANH